jgi:DNA-directed RNA polymerase specialized sigma subunit
MNELPYKKRELTDEKPKPSPELQAILDKLPKTSKEVAEAFYFTFDLNIHKTAKHLNITERSTRRRLKTANHKLEKLLHPKNLSL